MPGPWIHDIDPIIGTVFGVHLWWYGLSYALGFLNAHFFFMRRRVELGLSTREVYELSLLLSMGVLIGGRLIVVNNEWAFYRDHLALIPALWIGGMATHGLIIGGFAGVALFCLLRRKPLLVMIDEMAIPAALILCVGRIGNFIDGQIVGSITSVPWAVKFPDAEGFRHPVVLYDGFKNLLIVPVLMYARRRGVPPGGLAARFLFLYAFPRIFIDYFREYPLTLLGLPSGQTMNILMSAAGLALLWRNRRRPMARPAMPRTPESASGLWWRRALLRVRRARIAGHRQRCDARHSGQVRQAARRARALADVPADPQPASIVAKDAAQLARIGTVETGARGRRAIGSEPPSPIEYAGDGFRDRGAPCHFPTKSSTCPTSPRIRSRSGPAR